MSKECPICGSASFKPYSGRGEAQCARCNSLERGRHLWLALAALGLPRRGARVLHFAPERFLMDAFSERDDLLYHACDLDPARFPHPRVRVIPFDMSVDLPKLPSSTFDLVLHNHVLEHVPAPVDVLLEELARVTAPGGRHLFSVPFRGDHTDEDLSLELTAQERTARFAQADHVRIFGRRDFPALLSRVLDGARVFDVREHLSDDALARAGVPLSDRLSGESLFLWDKPVAAR